MVTTIDIADVTTGSLDGTGSFDVLMQTMTLHLMREYTAGRITGDIYAKAYIEVLNATLAQATQFVVSQAQVAANDELLAAQIRQIDSNILTNEAQVRQIDAQIELLGYQGISEQAKYLDTVDGLTIAGTIGKQKEIYAAQAKGFKDSALQSAAKTMIDTWSVRRTTDESTLTSPESKLYDGNIGNAIQEMFTSLNIPVASPPSIPAQTLKVGVAYTFDVTPYIVLPSGVKVTAYAVSGTLPAGISFAGGVFKGTPTATGTFLIDVTGTGSGQSITRSVTMNVADAV